MNVAQGEDIRAFRADDFQELITFFGDDLTGVPLSFAVRVNRDDPGAPIMTLTTAGGGGITIIDTGTEDDGTPYAVIQLLKAKTAFEALFAAYPAPRPGQDTLFAYDLQWTPPSDLVAPATPVEETILTGDFYIKGSVNT